MGVYPPGLLWLPLSLLVRRISDMTSYLCSVAYLAFDSLYGVVIGIQPLQKTYSPLSKVMPRDVYLPERSLYIIGIGIEILTRRFVRTFCKSICNRCDRRRYYTEYSMAHFSSVACCGSPDTYPHALPCLLAAQAPPAVLVTFRS